MPKIPESVTYNLIKSGKIKVRFGGKKPSPANHRFWALVDKNGPIHPTLSTKCWIYLGRDGEPRKDYGAVKVDGTSVPAHRYSYELHVSKILEGHLVCHRCDNHPCVNPEHLFTGTQQDNLDDMCLKGRHAIVQGEDFGHSKLTDEIVREIRRRYKPYCRINGIAALAKEFGTSGAIVSYAVNGKTWRHVT